MTPEQLKNMDYLPEDLRATSEAVGSAALNPLSLLRRLELAETLVKQLSDRGLVSDTDREIAALKSTVNHAKRIIDIRLRSGRPYSSTRKELLYDNILPKDVYVRIQF